MPVAGARDQTVVKRRHTPTIVACLSLVGTANLLAGPHIVRDSAKTFSVSLGSASPIGPASIREHAIAWHPSRRRFYLIADVIPLRHAHHPHTYDTELYLWRSGDLATWTLVGLAVLKGKRDVDFDGYGVASPAGMAVWSGRLYVPFSARKTLRFTQRSIGLAWSGPDPEVIPWTKTPGPISDLAGEDDDAAVVAVPGDDRLHLYHRTTGNGAGRGYRIVHTASPRPTDASSWPRAKEVTVRPAGVRAQELTGAICVDGRVHLFVIEQGTGVKGIQIAHLFSADPGGTFQQADPSQRYLLDQPDRLKDGGHFTPVVRSGRLIAAFWTVWQSGPRYGLTGHPVEFTHRRWPVPR